MRYKQITYTSPLSWRPFIIIGKRKLINLVLISICTLFSIPGLAQRNPDLKANNAIWTASSGDPEIEIKEYSKNSLQAFSIVFTNRHKVAVKILEIDIGGYNIATASKGHLRKDILIQPGDSRILSDPLRSKTGEGSAIEFGCRFQFQDRSYIPDGVNPEKGRWAEAAKIKPNRSKNPYWDSVLEEDTPWGKLALIGWEMAGIDDFNRQFAPLWVGHQYPVMWDNLSKQRIRNIEDWRSSGVGDIFYAQSISFFKKELEGILKDKSKLKIYAYAVKSSRVELGLKQYTPDPLFRESMYKRYDALIKIIENYE